MGTLLIRFIVGWFMTNKMRYTHKGGEFYAARTWKQHMQRAKWRNSPLRQRGSIATVFSLLIDVPARIMKLPSMSFCPHSTALCTDTPHNIHFIAEYGRMRYPLAISCGSERTYPKYVHVVQA